MKTAPEICHVRISTRAREGEDCIPLEYLQTCEKYHEYMLQDTSDQLLLDVNINIYEKKGLLEDWLYQIDFFIH
jgi:hypothetical protein